jgi:leucyl aminopeptidase
VQTTLQDAADPFQEPVGLLVIPVAAPATVTPGVLGTADAVLRGAVARAIESGELTGKAGRLVLLHAPPGSGPDRIALAGVGGGGTDDWRAACRAAAERAGELRLAEVALATGDAGGAPAVGAFIDGFRAGGYRFDRFRTTQDEPPVPVERLRVHAVGVTAGDLARADAVADAVASARDLVNTPANHLTPRRLAEHARNLADAIPGLEVTALGPGKLRKAGAGALLGVAQGSEEPPRLIVMRYTPEGLDPVPAAGEEVLGLVGKAVTFDTGGISIKPSAGMEEMKMDMGGGAAVIEATALIARRRLPVRVLAVVPATENMPSGSAVKPGDVLTAMSGRTIEVTNTDAEGRLILADALTWAVREGATRLVDLATLTGAIVVALGEVYAGLFGSDDGWTERVRAAGEASGDLAWPMPMHEGYRPLIESKVADLANSSSKRQAGAVYAAMFLREFTDGLPWCHVDIAGTGMAGSTGTGFGVRLLHALAEDMATP